ncbi:8495_t:CDS:2 [Funneliformis caledonium]|uniref:8495_t:CDS:1 n=1 Tax=Funneliformis caledonium TaxID=1117310 RepID=A0A9N9DGP1_9GLOM|nr:8495_t:CDS:2 [Funneliformis caledonium]
MSRNYLIFNIIWLIIQRLIEVNCEIKPQRRIHHSATYINNKLYILGGQDIDETDVDGVDNKTLILYGGRSFQTNVNMNLVYMFDTESESWKTTAENYTHKRSLSGLINSNGKMYLFGGRFDYGRIVNDILIFDTVNTSWRNVTDSSAPAPRINYGAVLLPNQTIIYLGGMNANNGSYSLREVYLYDTNNDHWDVKLSTGSIPSNRHGFSAVLGLNGQQIIIFGGRNEKLNEFDPSNSLYTLNINSLQWNIPNVSGKIPKSRHNHKANVFRKYMVISFGTNYDQKDESDILLLDINDNNKFKWTSLKHNNNKLEILLIIGSIIVIIVTVASIGIYKYKKRKETQYEIDVDRVPLDDLSFLGN